MGRPRLRWSVPITHNLGANNSHGRADQMGETDASKAHAAARTMLEVFATVGATRFEVTWTNIDEDKVRFQRASSAELIRTISGILDAAAVAKLNVIVRPEGWGVRFIQLDDLTADKLPAVAPAMFLILETSSGSFQAWAALTGRHDKEFARRVRRGTKADRSASGATRTAGSLNIKHKYAPNFPRVEIHAAQSGRMTTPAALERLGLVAPPDNFAPLPPASSNTSRRWPSYAKALDGAPLNRAGDGPDRSAADYVWCMTAITWNFGVEETAERLMEESAKAREYGREYARMTARNAAQAVERRRQQPRTAEHGRR
jgi:hypothetical protein